MNREKAIAFFRDMNECTYGNLEEVEMAIKALEQEPCEDAISRQAVLDCFKKWQPYMATRLHEFERELSDLPSVKPYEPQESEVQDADSN